MPQGTCLPKNVLSGLIILHTENIVLLNHKIFTPKFSAAKAPCTFPVMSLFLNLGSKGHSGTPKFIVVFQTQGTLCPLGSPYKSFFTAFVHSAVGDPQASGISRGLKADWDLISLLHSPSIFLCRSRNQTSFSVSCYGLRQLSLFRVSNYVMML